MTYELIGIMILGLMAIIEIGFLAYARREFLEQMRRNLALETQFQKWNADQTTSISQRLDQILEMIRTRQI